MPHATRQPQVSFICARVILILLALCLVVPFCEFSTHADEVTVVVDTARKPIEGHPIYVIAVPRQEKLPPRPLNIPIISSRPAPDAMLPADPQLLFDMAGPQLVKIGNGLLDDAEYQMALLYFQEAQKKDGMTPDVQRGLAHCYYGLKRDEE
ncbi:MAG TPA: hypothetical protein VJS17_06235, partial [Pyrinomonadaceae bacterium]|nr:hypothetical protein [Pyrinomonadaceae bacterium]